MQAGAYGFGAFAHGEQTHARGLLAAPQGADVEAGAVVGDAQRKMFVVGAIAYLDAGGARMLGAVVQRFLDDAE